MTDTVTKKLMLFFPKCECEKPIIYHLVKDYDLVVNVFRAKVVDTTTSSFVFELTGAPDKIDSFLALMRELGLVEVGRSGIVGMMRGSKGA